MYIFFVGFPRHSVIIILSTVTTYSICGNLFMQFTLPFLYVIFSTTGGKTYLLMHYIFEN
jgi:hypothetical protein